MKSFAQFLLEANSVGSKFEKKVAAAVKKWIADNGLSSKFSAKRFQTVQERKEEKQKKRDEDFSDIEVVDKESGKKFFIECKEATFTNIVTTQFDINEDMTVTPVQDKSRMPVEDELSMKLKADIENNEKFKAFAAFMNKKCDLVGGYTPAQLYFSEPGEIDTALLNKLISHYNSMIKSGKTESDNKPFDKSNLRDSTLNALACGLCWRLADESNTWDICHIESLPYFGDLVKQHYLKDKEVPAEYMQMNDELFLMDAGKNHFNINCTLFPSSICGKFDLKFTPRFGSGAMYITPRSSLVEDLKSECSFLDEERWPKVLN